MDTNRRELAERSSLKLRWYTAGLLLVLSSVLLLLIVRVAVSTPFQDELTLVNLYAPLAGGKLPPLSALIAAHNGHPLLIIKLLITITLRAGLPWSWMTYAQVPVLAGCLLVIFRRVTAGYFKARGLALLGVSLVLLSPRQWENLYWSMQLSVPLCLLASLTAFASTARFSESRDKRWLHWAMLLSIAASVSDAAGVFTLFLVAAALVVQKPGMRAVIVVGIYMAVGGSLFLLSQLFAQQGGIGSGDFQLARAAEHLTRMFALQVADFSASSYSPIVVGILAMFLAVYCLGRALTEWTNSLFEILCIVLGVVLIAVVTYARVTAGKFQPDAPRYLPLVAPISIGCLLLLYRWGNRLLLTASVIVLAAGYIASLRSEWRAGPSRRAMLTAAHSHLCAPGSAHPNTVHPVHNMKLELPDGVLRDLQMLFCADTGLTFIDHASIASATALGYFKEDAQTWIGPDLSKRK
jgi:hypothetical protein